MSELRLPRRRRSAARTPAIVDPADVPDDAPGRVELIVVRAPADVVGQDPPPPPPPQESSQLVDALLMHGGWVAVGVLGALIVAVFIVGMTLTR